MGTSSAAWVTKVVCAVPVSWVMALQVGCMSFSDCQTDCGSKAICPCSHGDCALVALFMIAVHAYKEARHGSSMYI